MINYALLEESIMLIDSIGIRQTMQVEPVLATTLQMRCFDN
jgi:hypothetical protein